MISTADRRTLAAISFALAASSFCRAVKWDAATPSIGIVLILSITGLATIGICAFIGSTSPPYAPPTTLWRQWAASGAAKLFTLGVAFFLAGALADYFTKVYYGPPPAFVTGWREGARLALPAIACTTGGCAFLYAGLATLDWEFHFIPRALRSQSAQDEDELFRKVDEIFHQARTK
jgi:hypothetical protein